MHKKKALVAGSKFRLLVIGVAGIALLAFVFGYLFASIKPDSEHEDTTQGEYVETSPAIDVKGETLDTSKILSYSKDEENEKIVPAPDEFTFTKNLDKKVGDPIAEPTEKPAPPTAKEKVEPVQKAKKIAPKVKQAKKTEEKPPVKQTKKTKKKPPVKGGFSVQVGSFTDKRDAIKFKRKLIGKGYKAYIKSATVKGTVWNRVKIGQFKTKALANKMAVKLKQKEKLPVMISPYDK